MPKTILLIDDEEDFLFFVKKNLELNDYRVAATSKGAEGIKLARDIRPDLILLDIMMPDMPGDKVAQQIKDNKSTKDIPIVFVTAAASKDEVSSRKGVVCGYPFIAKPVSEEEIIATIEKNIKKI
jgi:CheY-like chemotaxis protein